MLNEFLHRDVDVREALRRDIRRILYIAAWVMAAIGVRMEMQLAGRQRAIGVDSHAYWSAFSGPLYTSGPMVEDSYLYSPVFAQAVWPIAQLPWPIFAAVVSIADVATIVWLLKPLGWRWAVPLTLASTPEICSGNIFILLGAVAVAGSHVPGAWSLSVLTKVTPTMGPVWWVVRREWRPLLVFAATTAAIALPSVVARPDLWHQWLTLLVRHSPDSQMALGSSGAPPLMYRLPAGIAMTVWGAKTNRRWTIPVAMVLSAPVFWYGTYTMLAGIPRTMRRGATSPRRAPSPCPTSTTAACERSGGLHHSRDRA